MGLGPGDLVLCSGTLRRGLPLRDRAEAAVAGGFSAISLWGRDYAAARREGYGDSDIRTMLTDLGLAVAEIDVAWSWLPGAKDVHVPAASDSEEVFRFDEDELLAIAAAVGARSVNAVDVFGGAWSIDDAAEALAALCDKAARHDLLVQVEWLAWSRIPDLATAWEIVRRADRPNGGVNIDAWHYFRAGADEETLGGIPGNRIIGVQIDDGPAVAEGDLVHATLHERRLPGDGEFDLAGLVHILRHIGAVAPIGVEVLSDILHALPPPEAARRAGAAARRVLDGTP
jgi:sugar phosphate isomerase/epimerase